MLKLFAAICFALFFSHNALAQSKIIDSLKRVLPSLKDKERVDCLNELGFEYCDIHFNKSHYIQTDTALMYANEALSEATKLNYAFGIGHALGHIACVNMHRGNFIKAEEYGTQATLLFKETSSKDDYNHSLIGLGWFDHNEGKYKEALQNYYAVIPYYKEIRDSIHLAMVYRMVGYSYSEMGYKDSALLFYQKNDAIKKVSDDIPGSIFSPGIKGDMYLAAGDTAMAITFYLQSIDLAKAINPIINRDYTSMEEIYELRHMYDSALLYFNKNISLIKNRAEDSFLKKNNLIDAYLRSCELHLRLHNYDTVIHYCQKLIDTFTTRGHISALMPTLDICAKAYLGKHDNHNALFYGNKLLTYAEKADARPFIDDAYFILWQVYDALHKTPSAYNYAVKHFNLNDSIENNNYKAKLIAWDAITKMNIKEANYENQIQTTQERANMRVAVVSKQKQLQLYIFISAIVIIGLVVIIFTRNIKLNRRKEQLQFQANEAKAQLEVAALKQQTSELEMQALRSQMNPHFIFNCLSSINRFILKNKTEEASDYLTKFSRLIRMVLNNSKQSFISLEDELETLRLYLDMERLRFKNSFDYSFTYTNSVEMSNIFIPPLLLQPFAENAIWHGLMQKQEKGFLSFDFTAEERCLSCTITDNGIGREQAELLKSKSAERQKSLGLKITTERLSLLNSNANEQAFFTIEDLTDDNGNATGTRVHLKIFYKEMMEV